MDFVQTFNIFARAVLGFIEVNFCSRLTGSYLRIDCTVLLAEKCRNDKQFHKVQVRGQLRVVSVGLRFESRSASLLRRKLFWSITRLRRKVGQNLFKQCGADGVCLCFAGTNQYLAPS